MKNIEYMNFQAINELNIEFKYKILLKSMELNTYFI